ncbi:hypothetical protein B0H10DRAFT_2018526 [Mycena sp. CBHHK59/15]|nr:hypothetical protein B0H10DRAFT_2018526 [Mycena sp. CBHHK59/15]
MRPRLTFIRLYLTLGLSCYALSHPLNSRRNAGSRQGLAGLFGDGDGDDGDFFTSSGPETIVAPHQPLYPTSFTDEGLGGLFTMSAKGSSVQSVSAASHATSSLAPVSAPITTQSMTTAVSSLSTSVASATATIGVTQEAPNTPPGEAAQWKVIGIAAIGMGLIAAVMLSIIFFDSWWGFLRALVGKKKKERGMEDLVPDWGRRDWEFKIASEDGHRYPTLASLESMTKNNQDVASSKHTDSPLITLSPNPHHLTPLPPPSLYLPELDPHPLEPLFRRPSASNHPIQNWNH